MRKYYVNKNAQPNGDHEVHNETCPRLPEVINRLHLGEFTSCASAVIVAKKSYSKADGCYYCSPTCHHS
ncbi:hypothetical protein SAMN04487898_10886 [Pedobacter sp. ok626]|nr:hypothetical protein SAMN04487898_10886 [Pedobacter sp. ok626]